MKPDWTILREFAKYGFVGLIAGILLIFFLTETWANQRTAEIAHHDIKEAVTSIKDITGQSDMTQQQILWILEVICVNGADTPSARADCLRKTR